MRRPEQGENSDGRAAELPEVEAWLAGWVEQERSLGAYLHGVLRLAGVPWRAGVVLIPRTEVAEPRGSQLQPTT